MFSKLSVIFCLLLSLVFVSITNAEDIFRVAPYTLKHTNGQLILNFQLNLDKTLIIEDGNKTNLARIYKKEQQYQIELGNAECDTIKEVRILEADTKGVLFNKNFPNKLCPTNKEAADFVFGFISDSQLNRDQHENVAKVIAYHHSIEPLQFLINGGDIVQNGYKESEWLEYFKGGQAYLMDIPQIAAVGNHDYFGTFTYKLPKLFKQFLRWDTAEEYGNLFFDFPEFQLVVFNSNFLLMTTSDSVKLFGWLETKMKEAQKLNKPLILATHFPVYSSSFNKFTSQSVIILQQFLAPLVEKYKIPLVLSGHTHMYERSYKDGVNYLVAGPAGGKPNSPSANNPYVKYFDKDARTFTKIKYSHKSFTIETYNEQNVLIDSLLIKL
jgi:predicted phosphodiesterase